MLANNALTGGCAEKNRRRERYIVRHAHQVHRVQQTVRGLQNCCAVQKKGSNKCTSRSQNNRDCCRVKDTTESVKTKTYLEHVITLEFPRRRPNDDQLKSVVVVFVLCVTYQHHMRQLVNLDN